MRNLSMPSVALLEQCVFGIRATVVCEKELTLGFVI